MVPGALRPLFPSFRSSRHERADSRPANRRKDKFFNPDKGYGFIQPDDGGNDAFVHISAVQNAGMQTLDKEQRVSYELEQDRRGKTSAVNLQNA
jgi:CspA family cold shock protein